MAEPLVTVDSFQLISEAAIAKARLETEGIAAVVDDSPPYGLIGVSVGPYRVGVAEPDVARAREVLARLRAETAAAAAGLPAAGAAETCLRCGAPIPRAGERCESCGFSVEDEEPTDFANGPVPAALLAHAHLTVDRRFGIPARHVPLYVAWCRSAGFEIRGWELWNRSSLGHAVLDIEDEGSADELLGAVAKLAPEHAAEAWFSPNVRRAQSAGA